MVSQAYGYAYTPAYQYKGTATANGNNITYTPTGTTPDEMGQNAIDDLARFLGGLYRGAGVQQLVYSGTTYTWDDNNGLKGSNWVHSGTTLVSVIAAAYPFNSLTFTADGTDITFTIAMP
jgi:hypothetical protein